MAVRWREKKVRCDSYVTLRTRLFKLRLPANNQEVGRTIMPGGRPRYSFACPSCDALYELVKVEAGPETVDGEVACRSLC